jgi:hypothetical protein
LNSCSPSVTAISANADCFPGARIDRSGRAPSTFTWSTQRPAPATPSHRSPERARRAYRPPRRRIRTTPHPARTDGPQRGPTL